MTCVELAIKPSTRPRHTQNICIISISVKMLLKYKRTLVAPLSAQKIPRKCTTYNAYICRSLKKTVAFCENKNENNNNAKT